MKQSYHNPWLGLKSYPEGVTLYGRNKEITELSQKILYNTQTIIYGRSGIGKSSLLNAGVFPVLRKHNLFPVYIRLMHGNEQESYSKQIFSAVEMALKTLKVEDLSSPTDIYREVQGYKEEVVRAVDSTNESLWEYFHRNQFFYQIDGSEPQAVMPVLVFDQFEEIFTLQKEIIKIKTFFDELADLINNICPKELLVRTVDVKDEETPRISISNSLIKKGIVRKTLKNDYIDDSNFHIVISIREDFLSHLERNISHIPLLKHNRYCLFPLSEDQAAEIIMKPIPGLVSSEVAKEIICKVTGVSSDCFEIDDTPELEVDSAILSLFLSELFDKIDSNENIISLKQVVQAGDNIIAGFYKDTIQRVSLQAAIYLENHLITDDGRRDAMYYEQAIGNGIAERDLKFLFKQRVLNKYSWRQGIRIEFSHDILCPIIMERRKARKEEEERIRQNELLVKAQKDKRRLLFLIIALILSVALSAWYCLDSWVNIKITRYARIYKENSWMTGLKELSEEEASHLEYSFWFYKKGRRADNAFLVEARDGYGNLTTQHNMGTYLLNQLDDTDNNADKKMKEKLATVVKWELVSDNTGTFCLQEKAYDKEGNLIFSYNNNKRGEHEIVSTYTDDMGFPITMRDTSYIFLHTILDDNGREIIQKFYDDKGFPVMNMDSAFMTEKKYFPNGLKSYEASLFVNGNRMLDRAGNSGWKILETTEDGFNETLSIFFDTEELPCYVTDGTMVKKWEYDTYGRCTKETYWRLENTAMHIDQVKELLDKGQLKLFPDTNQYGIHGYLQEFNSHGQSTKFVNIGLDNQPCMNKKTELRMITRTYDDNGNLTSVKAYDMDETPYWVDSCLYDNQNRCIFERRFQLSENSDTIWLHKLDVDQDTQYKTVLDYVPRDNYYSRSEYDDRNNQTLYAWYKMDTNLPDTTYGGRHKVVTEYEYKSPNLTILTEKYYDMYDKPCRSEINDHTWKLIVEVDSLANFKSYYKYTLDNIRGTGTDHDDIIKEYFYQGTRLYFKDNKFAITIGEASIDEEGKICRYYENPAYYYIVQYIKSIRPDAEDDAIDGFYAINEFGESSILRSGGNNHAAVYRNQRYDEYGRPISDNTEDQPLLCDISVEDPMGRIRKGDILVQMDNWSFWNKTKHPVEAFVDLDTSPNPHKPHNLKVLRFNEENRNYDLEDIHLPAGDEIIPRIKFNLHYCTKKEKLRIDTVLAEKLYPHIFTFIPKEGSSLYEKGMKTDGIILKINEWEMDRHFMGQPDSLVNIIQQYKGQEKHVYFINIETQKISRYTINTDTLEGKIIPKFMNPPAFRKVVNELQLFKASENNK